jgi:formate dehydrogenase subunit gamma
LATLKKGNKVVKKFSWAQRAFHWTYGISWILLVLTGITFVWRPDPHAAAGGLGPLVQGTVGAVLRTTHRVAAIGLMVAPFIWLLGDVKSLWPDLKELLTFTRLDAKYMAVAPLHYTIGKPGLPPQGKYNGGHKVNFYVVILTFVAFVVTGLGMWFGRGTMGKDAFNMMRIIHSISFWGSLAMGLLHMYLTAIHPFTGRSLKAMTRGYVDLDYARLEHSVWVEQAAAAGQIVEEAEAR